MCAHSGAAGQPGNQCRWRAGHRRGDLLVARTPLRRRCRARSCGRTAGRATRPQTAAGCGTCSGWPTAFLSSRASRPSSTGTGLRPDSSSVSAKGRASGVELPSRAASARSAEMPIALISTKGSRPSGPNSRPIPLDLTPPMGARKPAGLPLSSTVPVCIRPATRSPRSVSRREDRAVEPVHRVVGDGDRLVLGLVGDDGQHRSEDLLLRDRGVRIDVGEHGRLDEPARGPCPWVGRHP